MKTKKRNGWKAVYSIFGAQHVFYKDDVAQIAIRVEDGVIWFPERRRAKPEAAPSGLSEEEVKRYAETLWRMS